MKNVIFFDRMITPNILTLVYWLMLLGVVGYGLSVIFGGFGGFTLGKLFQGVLIIVGGAIGVRIWCELLIVLFKMNEALQAMREPR